MAIATVQPIFSLLTKVTDQLQTLHLWQYQPLAEHVLVSQQPFCCDTLSFEQWLQFVFIPRFSQMIAMQQPLPTNIALCPMAEESFKPLGKKAAALINTLADIDEHLSGQRQQTLFIDYGKKA